MRVKGVSQRLDFSTQRLTRAEWRLLGALAMERELARSQLMKLATSFGALDAARPRASAAAGGALSPRDRAESARVPGPKEAWPALDDWLGSGLVVDVGEARGPGLLAPLASVHLLRDTATGRALPARCR